PGVLAEIAGVFSEHGVSVEAVEQSVPPAAPPGEEGTASLFIGTHAAMESALSGVVDALARLEAVVAVRSVLRVEGE
ncbi:MAG TPA: ACT domain-containing protein, partial [Naasia sp.]